MCPRVSDINTSFTVNGHAEGLEYFAFLQSVVPKAPPEVSSQVKDLNTRALNCPGLSMYELLVRDDDFLCNLINGKSDRRVKFSVRCRD